MKASQIRRQSQLKSAVLFGEDYEVRGYDIQTVGVQQIGAAER
jgi:hypothetical protein